MSKELQEAVTAGVTTKRMFSQIAEGLMADLIMLRKAEFVGSGQSPVADRAEFRLLSLVALFDPGLLTATGEEDGFVSSKEEYDFPG